MNHKVGTSVEELVISAAADHPDATIVVYYNRKCHDATAFNTEYVADVVMTKYGEGPEEIYGLVKK